MATKRDAKVLGWEALRPSDHGLAQRVQAEEHVLDFLADVQKLMARLHITQAEVARRMHVSRVQVNRWLGGQNGMNAKTMFHLANSLGFELELEWKPVLKAVEGRAHQRAR